MRSAYQWPKQVECFVLQNNLVGQPPNHPTLEEKMSGWKGEAQIQYNICLTTTDEDAPLSSQK